MPDLALGAGRPFSLVTTVVHRSANRCKLALLDLHLTAGAVRIRFLDTDTLLTVSQALSDLSLDATAPDPLDYRPVRSRLYTEQDAFGTDAPATVPIQRSLFTTKPPF